MSEAARSALERHRDVLRAALADIEAVLASVPAAEEWWPVKTCASFWGVGENAALKRVRKIGTKMSDERWYALESVARRQFVRMRPPVRQDAAR